jgi:hypothetical protein
LSLPNDRRLPGAIEDALADLDAMFDRLHACGEQGKKNKRKGK